MDCTATNLGGMAIGYGRLRADRCRRALSGSFLGVHILLQWASPGVRNLILTLTRFPGVPAVQLESTLCHSQQRAGAKGWRSRASLS